MNAHVLKPERTTLPSLRPGTPADGLLVLTATVGGHLLALERLEQTFFGTMLEAIRPEKRKEVIQAFLEHQEDLKEGAKEILYHKDRLAATLGVEIFKYDFEQKL